MIPTNNKYGVLFLIPVFLGNEDYEKSFPEVNKHILSDLKHFVAENSKLARSFLKKIIPSIILADLHFEELNEHSDLSNIHYLLKPLIEGKNIGLMSDAGCPGIADPGSPLILQAHKMGIKVVPLVGPSSILLSVMASGLNGQCFSFIGYLPKDKKDRKNKIKELEKLAVYKKQSQFFIETPYRNQQLFEEILENCSLDTKFMVACDLSIENEFILTLTVGDWRKREFPQIHKKPCMFGIG